MPNAHLARIMLTEKDCAVDDWQHGQTKNDQTQRQQEQ
jgi:hypothetical protein